MVAQRLKKQKWFCPWCDKDFPYGEECGCEPCEGCGARAYWACTCNSCGCCGRSPCIYREYYEAVAQGVVVPSVTPVCMLCGSLVPPNAWCGCSIPRKR